MNTKTTTDLETIRRRPNNFTWGKVKEIYDVGPLNPDCVTRFYSIVETYPREEKGEVQGAFHVYVDGNDMSTSANSFEEALVLAVACRLHGGTFSRGWEAGRFAMKVLTP